MTHQLKLTHLRFDCIADTPIKLGGAYAGANLRNGLANVMRRAICADTQQRGQPSPEHAETCPACWLLASNLDPGTVIRAYTIAPPLPLRHALQPGKPFSFGLTIIGDGLQYLPYFVLALNDVGRVEGIGPDRREGNGRFHIHTISAVDPLRGDAQLLRSPGDSLVHVPTLHVDAAAVAHISALHMQQLSAKGELTLHFHTPLRLIEQKQPLRAPDFGVFFRRLLYRVDELNRQFAGGERRDKASVEQLYALADKVRLLAYDGRWHELWMYSSRDRRKKPHSGFTGTAVYRADDWTPLLPWLIWGQGAQVGKATTKGNGVYSLDGDWPDYWAWMQPEPV